MSTAVDVRIFRHEFINIFRLIETASVHPTDIRILETIDDQLQRYEEDSGTVFLAKQVIERMQRLAFTGHASRARPIVSMRKHH